MFDIFSRVINSCWSCFKWGLLLTAMMRCAISAEHAAKVARFAIRELDIWGYVRSGLHYVLEVKGTGEGDANETVRIHPYKNTVGLWRSLKTGVWCRGGSRSIASERH